MKHTGRIRKTLSWLLCVCMAITLLPAGALAIGPELPATPTVVSSNRICANGAALIITGTGDTATTVYVDTNRDGELDDGDWSLKTLNIENAPEDGDNLSSFLIFGGSQSGDITGDTKITMLGGKVSTIYGGNFSSGSVRSTNITVSGGQVTYIYGGGGEGTSVTGSTTVTVNGGAATTIYGGGYKSTVSDTATVNISGGEVSNVYGGGLYSSATGSTSVTVSGGKATYVYGGGSSGGTVSGSTAVSISGNAQVSYVYGGGSGGTVTGSTNVTISDAAQVSHVYGGGSSSGQYTGTTGDTNVTISGGTVTEKVHGGGTGTNAKTGKTTVTISGTAQVKDVYGGGTGSSASTGDTTVKIEGGSVTGSVYGGSLYSSSSPGNSSGSTHVSVTGGTVAKNVYGGGYGNSTCPTGTSSTEVTISGGTVTGSVYGGGYNSGNTVTGSTEVKITNGTVGQNVYGGGNYGAVTVNTTVTVSGGTAKYVYGGGSSCTVSGSTNVNISGEAEVSYVYGGGGTVTKGTNVNITGGTVTNNVYGGGGTVSGDRLVTVGGTAKIGKNSYGVAIKGSTEPNGVDAFKIASESALAEGASIYIKLPSDFTLGEGGTTVATDAEEGDLKYLTLTGYSTAKGLKLVGTEVKVVPVIGGIIDENTTTTQAKAMLGGKATVTGTPGALTITLDDSVELTTPLRFAGGTHTLDLYGRTLSAQADMMDGTVAGSTVTVGVEDTEVDLTITDSVGNGSIQGSDVTTWRGGSAVAIEANGKLILGGSEKFTLWGGNGSSSGGCGVLAQLEDKTASFELKNAAVTLKGGTGTYFYSGAGALLEGINLSVTINGGTFQGTYPGSGLWLNRVQVTAPLNIVSATGRFGVAIENTNVTIESGTFTGTGDGDGGLDISGSSTVLLKGGTFIGQGTAYAVHFDNDVPSGKVGDLLAPGYDYYQNDVKITGEALNVKALSGTVTVRPPQPSVDGEGTIFANGAALLITGTAEGTTIYVDTNRNGVLDEGEKSLKSLDVTDAPEDDADLSNYTVYGGSSATATGDTQITMLSGQVGYIYGGGNNGSVTGNTNVTITGGTVTGSIYGGGRLSRGDSNADVNGEAAITIKDDAQVKLAVYGGAYADVAGQTVKVGSTVVTIQGGTVGSNVYGGGYAEKSSTSAVTGAATVRIEGGTVNARVYGGGGAQNNSYTSEGSTSVTITGGTVTSYVYGSGGTNDTVTGGTSVTVGGTAKIGTTNNYGQTETGVIINGGDPEITNGVASFHIDPALTGDAKVYIVLPEGFAPAEGGTKVATGAAEGNLNFLKLARPGAAGKALTRDEQGNVKVVVPAAAPTISAQPAGATYTQNAVATALAVTATASDGGSLSYQWYSNATNSNSGGTLISGATSASYTPHTTAVGTTYYYCVITNTLGSQTSTATTNAVKVDVTTPTYTVTYAPGANGAGNGDTATKTQGVALTLKGAIFTRTGYTQTGWATSDNGVKVYELSGTYSDDAAVTLYPVWTVNSYTVTFNANGHGTAPGALTGVVYNSTITAPTAPTATGYTFGGWYKEAACTNEWNFSTDTVTADITLYAKWTANSYAITYAGMDEATHGTNHPAQHTYGTATAVPNPEKTGYTFDGWKVNNDSAAVKNLTLSADGYIANITLTATWTVNQYKITFDTDGGTEIPAITQNYGTAITAPEAPTKTGHTFEGWDKAIPTTMPAENLTIKANWTANTYTVTFDAKGHGTAPGALTEVVYNSTITAPTAPTATGYTFVGWYKEDACTTVWNFTTDTVTEDITLYAKWTADPILGGTITGTDYSDVTAKLVALDGTATAAAVTGSAPTWNYVVSAPAGQYNLVVTAEKGGQTITVTSLVDLTMDISDKDISLPTENTNSSVVEVTGADTPKAIVGGLDTIAKDETPDGITIKLTVEKKADVTASTEPEDAAQKAVQTAIKTQAGGRKLDFIDMTLTKNGDPSIGSSNSTVLEIVIPFATSGKVNITVYRYHGTEAAAMKKDAPDGNGEYFTLGDGFVTIHAKKFSTYAIGYDEPAPPSTGATRYTITASAGEGGAISPSGSVRVTRNSDKIFTVTADSGYEIADVLVDGQSVGAVDSYTFEKVTKAHTIEARFRKANARPAWNPFTDVTEGDWFHDSVRYVYENGLMLGTGSDRFSPYVGTARGMIVTTLWRLEGSPVVNYAMDFEDVDPGAYYGEAIRWAVSENVALGYGNGRFGPDDLITREQLAVVLWRYAGSPDAPNLVLTFPDANDVSGWAADAVRWAVSQGIIGGTDLGTLMPKASATRAQVATMLMRYLESTR